MLGYLKLILDLWISNKLKCDLLNLTSKTIKLIYDLKAKK